MRKYFSTTQLRALLLSFRIVIFCTTILELHQQYCTLMIGITLSPNSLLLTREKLCYFSIAASTPLQSAIILLFLLTTTQCYHTVLSLLIPLLIPLLLLPISLLISLSTTTTTTTATINTTTTATINTTTTAAATRKLSQY